MICTSNLPDDEPLCRLAKRKSRLLSRKPRRCFTKIICKEKYKAKYVINITADCPLVDPYYIDKVASKIRKSNFDLIRTFDLPHGIFIYGIKVKALEKICKIKIKTDTEIWERYFTDTGLFKVHDLKIPNQKHVWPGLRLTLDYPEDLKLIKKIFTKLYKKKQNF